MSQDQTRPQASADVQIDNSRVIVTQWSFMPGAQTGWHTHHHEYIVVPVTDGVLQLETETGTVQAQLRAGQSYTRPVGVQHNVINAGTQPLIFVEIELRQTQ